MLLDTTSRSIFGHSRRGIAPEVHSRLRADRYNHHGVTQSLEKCKFTSHAHFSATSMAASFRSRGRAARERSNRHAYTECIIDSFSQRFQKSYPKISSDPPKIYFGYANAKNVASGGSCVILRCSMRHTQANVQTSKLKCYVLISSENKKSRAKR